LTSRLSKTRLPNTPFREHFSAVLSPFELESGGEASVDGKLSSQASQPVQIKYVSKTGLSIEGIFKASKLGIIGANMPFIDSFAIRPLPSMHWFLGPFYILVGLMSCVLVADLFQFLSQMTPMFPYVFLGDLGPVITLLAATIVVWKAYRSRQGDHS
jgi:hypothetical protein